MLFPRLKEIALTVSLLLALSGAALGADDALVPFWKEGLYGYMDRSGRTVIEPQYEGARPFSEGRGAVCVKEKWGFVDATGKTVVEPQYEEVGVFSGSLAWVRRGGRCGYIDPSGKEAIPAQFGEAFDFSEGLGLAKFDGGGCGFIDRTGKRAFDATFDAAWPFSEGLACIRQGARCGYVDLKGKVVIEPTFRAARRFSGGFAAVKVGRLWGFIDRTGKTIVEPAWEEVGDFGEGLARASTGGLFGYVDAAGKVVVKPAFVDARDFSEGLAAVKVGTTWGYIDRQGKTVIAPKFERADAFEGGTACVVVGRETTLIDRTGRLLVVNQPFDQMGRAAEGLIPVRLGAKWGYADAKGQIVIPLQFDMACAFSDGLAAVAVCEERDPRRMRDPFHERDARRAMDGFGGEALAGVKWGFVDRTGRVVVAPEYASVGPFREGIARVAVPRSKERKEDAEPDWTGPTGPRNRNVLWGYIDRAGKRLVEPKFTDALDASEGLACVCDGDGYGYVDRTGKTVIAPEFVEAGPFHDGRAMVALAEKDRWGPGRRTRGYIDRTGKIVIPARFEFAGTFSDGLARVYGDEDHRGPDFHRFIDVEGRVVIGAAYQYVGGFHEGLACVKGGEGLYGYIDKVGKPVIPCLYGDAGDFSEGLARVTLKNRPSEDSRRGTADGPWQFIDKTGKVVLGEDLRLNHAGDFHEGRAFAIAGRAMGYMDREGEWVVMGGDLYFASVFSEGLLALQGRDRLFGYVDRTGKEVIPPQFDAALPFSEGLAPVRKGHPADSGCGYIDKTGQFVIKPSFRGALPFSEGLAAVTVHGEWGYIDKTGKSVIEPQFRDPQPFSEGLAAVDNRDYIDRTGKVVFGGFSRVSSFSEGLALVEIENAGRDGRWPAFVNKKGEVVLGASVELAGEFSEGMAPVKSLDGKWGFIDKTGVVTIRPQFTGVGMFRHGLARFFVVGPPPAGKSDYDSSVGRPYGKWGFIDKTGRVVIPPSFRNALDFTGDLAFVELGDGHMAYVDATGKVVMKAGRGWRDWPDRFDFD